MSDIDNVISLIQEQMNKGIGTMRFKTSDELENGDSHSSYHFGRIDSAAEWMHREGISEHDILDHQNDPD